MVRVYALFPGIQLGRIRIGQPWNPPPLPECLPVRRASSGINAPFAKATGAAAHGPMGRYRNASVLEVASSVERLLPRERSASSSHRLTES